MYQGFALAKKSFERDQVYLLNHLINNIGSIIFGYINVSIWLAVLGNTPDGREAVTYIMLNQAVLWLVMFLPYGCYIPEKVYSGSIVYEMLRPYSLMYGSFFEVIGHTFYNLLFRSIPIFLFGVFMLGVNLPSISQVLPYMVTVVNAIILAYLINYFIGLWSMKFLSINGAQMMYYFFVHLFSGGFMQLKYYPEFMQDLVMRLPFAYTIYVPSSVYLGQIKFKDAFVGQVFWIICLFVIAKILTRRIAKKMAIQGG